MSALQQEEKLGLSYSLQQSLRKSASSANSSGRKRKVQGCCGNKGLPTTCSWQRSLAGWPVCLQSQTTKADLISVQTYFYRAPQWWLKHISYVSCFFINVWDVLNFVWNSQTPPPLILYLTLHCTSNLETSFLFSRNLWSVYKFSHPGFFILYSIFQ